jgi:hypothetical protein
MEITGYNEQPDAEAAIDASAFKMTPQAYRDREEAEPVVFTRAGG